MTEREQVFMKMDKSRSPLLCRDMAFPVFGIFLEP